MTPGKDRSQRPRQTLVHPPSVPTYSPGPSVRRSSLMGGWMEKVLRFKGDWEGRGCWYLSEVVRPRPHPEAPLCSVSFCSPPPTFHSLGVPSPLAGRLRVRCARAGLPGCAPDGAGG